MRSMTMMLVAAALLTSGLEAPSFAQSDWMKSLEADCKAGKGFACKQWGEQLDLGVFRPAEPVKARAAFERGCALKEDLACIALFKMLSLGRGGPKDMVRARKLEPAACATKIISVSVDLEQAGLCKSGR
jgi:hypothetical protein